MAFWASSSVAISTKAKPRARPVAMSRMIFTESTAPACPNRSWSSVSPAENGRFPTYNFRAMRASCASKQRKIGRKARISQKWEAGGSSNSNPSSVPQSAARCAGLAGANPLPRQAHPGGDAAVAERDVPERQDEIVTAESLDVARDGDAQLRHALRREAVARKRTLGMPAQIGGSG